MFGALLGTLQKFRQEETKLKAKVFYFNYYIFSYNLSEINYLEFSYLKIILIHDFIIEFSLQEDKKAEVEARVEEAKRKEREELKKERQQLFLNRKQQLAQVKALETKVARSKTYQEWRSAQIPLLNFIKTKTQPHIYYLPKRSTPETDTLLQESSKLLKGTFVQKKFFLLNIFVKQHEHFSLLQRKLIGEKKL